MHKAKAGSPYVRQKKNYWPHAVLLTMIFIVIPTFGNLAATYFSGS